MVNTSISSQDGTGNIAAVADMEEVPIDGEREAGVFRDDGTPLPERPRRKLCRTVTICLACIGLIGIIVSVVVSQKNESSVARRSTTEDIVAYLKQQGVSRNKHLNDETSPQYQTVLWMAEDDPANLKVPNKGIDTNVGYDFLARYVLALNHFAMNGPNWDFQLDFLSEKDICNWNAWLTDRNQFYRSGVWCDDDKSLPIELYLDFNKLSGEIPTENGLLTTLTTFDAKVNDLSGSIPTELCELTNLRSLSVGFNSMTGKIPECIDNLSNLLILFIGNNLLTGDIPSSLGNMHGLTRLIIDDNFFESDISVFNGLDSLELLYAEENLLSGILDGDFLNGLTELAAVDLSGNNITSSGGIPSHLFEMPKLQTLDLSRNLLEGHVHVKTSNNTNLGFVSLHNNLLNGMIPTELANLQRLYHLDLSNNNFHGDLPNELGSILGLEYLFLANLPNIETGPVPETFGDLIYLEELSLKNSRRTGELPEFLSSLQELILLDLDSNGFNGTIPESYGSLTSLQFLLLNRNAIDGNVPASFGNLTRLRVVLLDGTDLSGDLKVLCDLDTFNEPDGDLDGNELLMANCGGNAAPISCDCCQCCNPTGDSTSCSDPALSNLDAQWEFSFGRVVYDFGNRSAW